MIIRSTALALPLRDACVDLIVTSPPYFSLRSYRDDGEHYAGQVGSEETPSAFVDALIEATKEMVRVLKPTGSIFVNLGDKYAGSGGHNNSGISGGPSQLQGASQRRVPVEKATRRNAPDRYNQNSGGIPAKSLMGLPWRYANACVDQLGLILRAEIIWSKPNGLPESVTDRVRRSHETWFHFVKQGRYFSAVDEIREAHDPRWVQTRGTKGRSEGRDQEWAKGGVADIRDKTRYSGGPQGNPLGKLPGSVWTIPTEPLTIPDWARDKYNLPDHFAAFPQEWPRRIILGWSPSGICTKCGEGRRPVVDKPATGGFIPDPSDKVAGASANGVERNRRYREMVASGERATITGYACACDVPIAATRPAIVLDPFGGTGTVAMVARALGRTGLNGDLSGDYGRLARWRIYESGHAAKSEERTWRDAQGSML